jgi:DNA-binding XRE family transcriptional regulator
VAELAGRRHAALQAALAGDAWRLDGAVIAHLRDMLAADQALAARAAGAARQTVAALQALRGGRRMQDGYAAQAAGA